MEGIIGHYDIINKIIKSIQTNKIAHAHLFVGEDGIGKSVIAHAIAIYILNNGEAMDKKEYVDLKEYKILDNKKSILVEQVRAIIEEINKKPYEGYKKVIIVYAADKMTSQAQNAFLKTIEEPPKGVFIFLLCENIENVLDTVKSRCQIHNLKKLSNTEIDSFLIKYYPKLTEETKKTVVAYCDGIPGKAKKFIEDDSFIEIRENIINIIDEINKKNMPKLLEYESFLLKYKDVWQDVLECFISYIRDIIIYKETGTDRFIINLDKLKFIKELASVFSYKKLNSMIDIINDTRTNFQSNVNANMLYHIMLIKMQETEWFK